MKSSFQKNSRNNCIPENFSGMHYITLAAMLIMLFSANIAFGAEGFGVPLKKVPIITGKTGAASENTNKTYVSEEALQKAGEKSLKETPEEQKGEKVKSPFIEGIFNMFRALFGVLALIAGLSGAVLFYKWLKSKSAILKTEQEAMQASLESREPETVSEAVASFVKHRIKK